jgi:hypothetical protein
MTGLLPNYDAWRLAGPPEAPDACVCGEDDCTCDEDYANDRGDFLYEQARDRRMENGQ